MVVCGLCLVLTGKAQNAYDAERVLGNELNGTARFVGMGGAMSALGGDMSVMGTNPAGIGIFRSNDLSISFGLNNTETESLFNGTQSKRDNSRTSLDQIGFVYSYKVGNNTSLRFVNFGFNYHKSKNFNRVFFSKGKLNGFSQSNYIADEMDAWGMQSAGDFDALLDGSYEKYWYGNGHSFSQPMLGVMGAKTGIVDFVDGMVLGWPGDESEFLSKEKGGISQYDFNIAFNIEDRFYLGATMGIYDLNYSKYSCYTEFLNDDTGGKNGGYTLHNYYDMDGSGLDLKLGAIIRPFEESPFRLGLAVHTPTWYDITEYYDAELSSDITYYGEKYNQRLSGNLNPDYLIYDYHIVTPWKFNVSMGTTISNLIALGAEYEYQDYSSTKLEDMDGYELGDQQSVEEFLKGIHTFRAGIETRLASSFSLRAGYNFSTATFTDDAYNALSPYRTNTDFNNLKSKNTFTFGLGYRGNVFYADMALKYDLYKSEFCAFDSNYNFETQTTDLLPYTEVDNSRLQLLFTLGIKL